jgi:methylase of polypeptide subunit release factors
MTENFVDQHWQKIGSKAINDFRAISVAKKALQLLGNNPGSILDIGAGSGTFVVQSYLQGC